MLCTSRRLYSYHDEENIQKSGSKKVCTEEKSSHWLLTIKKVSEGGKNRTNRLEVLKKSEKRLKKWENKTVMQ
jgi:hypothetical protein